MIKKKGALSILLILLICLPAISGYASNYWSLSSNTFVENYHEGYWSDKYIGTVSVYGKDIILRDNSNWYPTFSYIKYNVQGDITTAQVNSLGQNDDVQRIKEITVYDRWNAGPETTCNYDFGLARRSSGFSSYTINFGR